MNKKIILGCFTVLLFFIFSPVYSAAPVYTFLEPLPNLPVNPDLPTYIPYMINLIIGISVVLAFVMITYGGIRYATTDALSGKEEGRKDIENALIGLLLVIGAYAILATVNPAMLSFDLSTIRSVEIPDLPGVETGGNGGTGSGGVPLPPVATPNSSCINDPQLCSRVNGILQGYKLTAEQTAENKTIRDDLLYNSPPFGVVVNNGPCSTGGTRGCTNVVGLPANAISNIKGLASDCKCTVVITGGTEGGHAEHAPGLAVYDLSPSAQLNAYLKTPNPINNTSVTVNGVQYTYETTGANGRASGNHWHAEPAK